MAQQDARLARCEGNGVRVRARPEQVIGRRRMGAPGDRVLGPAQRFALCVHGLRVAACPEPAITRRRRGEPA